MRRHRRFLIAAFAAAVVTGGTVPPAGVDYRDENRKGTDADIRVHAACLVREGREIFRFDSLGSEAFWGCGLRPHEAIAGAPRKGH